MAVTLDTTTTYKITRKSSNKPSLRINRMQLGDGYVHSSIDGINYDEESWFIDFLDLELVASITLRNLLNESITGNEKVLAWTPPGESTVKYWEAIDISHTPGTGVMWHVSCTLKRAYPII